MVRFSLLGLLALAGCATASPPAPAYIHVCPVTVTYSKVFEQQAGHELAALPPNEPMAKMVMDYIALRQEVADCQKGASQ